MAKGPAGIRRETSLLRLVRAGTIAARKAAAAKKKRDKRDKRDKRMITEEFIMQEPDENDSLVVDVLRDFEFWKHFTFKLSPRKTNVRIAVPYSDGRHGLGEIGIVSEWSDYTVYRGSGCSYTFIFRDHDDPCQIVVKQKSRQLTDWLLKHSNLIKINHKVMQTINNAGN